MRTWSGELQARPPVKMNRWYFNARFAGALAAVMFLTSAGSAAADIPRPGRTAETLTSASTTVPATAAQHASGDAMANIDSCVARLDPQLDIGYARIAARCPELMRQLEAGAWAPWLPRSWKEPGNDLSAGSLEELRELVARESDTRLSNLAKVPDVRSLQPILASLAGDRDATGWSRFKSWLRSILERREQPTDESWFSRMVSHAGLSQSVIRIVSYAALAVVVLMAGVIVVNELRAAGLLSGSRDAAQKRGSGDKLTTSGLRLGDIEQTPLRDRPRLLLELIVRRLSDRGLLPPAGALTIRELTRAARLPEAQDRSRLEELALAAERVRYSRAGLQPDSLEEPVAGGRVLLDRLETADGLKANASRMDAGVPG